MSDDDLNEAYDVIPMPETEHGPQGWWTVTMNGVPVIHGPTKEKMEAFAGSAQIRADWREKRRKGRAIGGLT